MTADGDIWTAVPGPVIWLTAKLPHARRYSMYLIGEGVQTDPDEGLQWLRRAAEQGDESSLRLLADVYRKGAHGISADAVEAQLWGERYRNTDLYRLRLQRWGTEGA